MKRYFIPLSITLGCSILFFLPGKVFPKDPNFFFFELVKPDKIAHVVLFACMQFFWCRALSWPIAEKLPIFKTRTVALLAIAHMAFGLLVEAIQGQFISNRSFELADLVADTLGALLGCFVYYQYTVRKSKAIKSISPSSSTTTATKKPL